MDEYLQCLYEYIAERRINSLLWSDPHYRQYSDAYSDAGEELEELLTAEQKAALERYQSAESDLVEFESKILFQEAVALGRWFNSPGQRQR